MSRVDAGTIELIRSYEVEVVSSADLIQTFEARWTDRQLESHQFAAAALRRIVDQTFSHVHEAITQERSLTEYGVQQFILARIREAGMVTSSAPIAAVNAHSADPHYGPRETGSAEVTRDALLLIDLWAKRTEPGSVYGDITWTGYVGRNIPVKQREIFDLVRQGRDAALTFVRDRNSCRPSPLRLGSRRGLPAGHPAQRLWRSIRSSHGAFDRRRGSWQRRQHRWLGDAGHPSPDAQDLFFLLSRESICPASLGSGVNWTCTSPSARHWCSACRYKVRSYRFSSPLSPSLTAPPYRPIELIRFSTRQG